MFCRFCGNQNDDYAAFCKACGRPIEHAGSNVGTAADSSTRPSQSSSQTMGLPQVQTQTMGLPVTPMPEPVPAAQPQPTYYQAPVAGMYPNFAPFAGNYPQQKMKVKRKINIFGIIAAAVVVLSVFLPFIELTARRSHDSASLINGSDGIIFLVVAAIAAVFSLVGLNIGTLCTGVVSLGLSVFEVIYSFNYKKSELDMLSAKIHGKIGMYINLIGSILIIVAAIIGMTMREKQLKDARRLQVYGG